MKCPIDGATLSMSSREDVEIDYCPECRGVWLDRGELDKIIDRAAASLAPPLDRPAPQAADHEHDRHHDDRDRDRDRRYDDHDHDRRYDRGQRYDDRSFSGGPRKKKRRNFLEDLFEFD